MINILLKTKEKEKNTYCLVCKKKTDNKEIRRVPLVNKIETQRTLCTDCSFRKSTFLKPIKSNEKKK